MPCLIPFFNPALGNKVDVLVIGKERWFRVSDIAKVLGYWDGSSIEYRWKEEIRAFTNTDLQGVNLGARSVRFITSDGLLAFLISSSRPLAQLLRKWVVEDVLPSVDSLAFDTNTGQSALDKAILKEFEAVRKLRNQRNELQEQVHEQMKEVIQGYAHAMVSWLESAPSRHVKLFQEAFQERQSNSNTSSAL